MKKNRKQWLAALGLLGATFWGCENIDLFPNRYIDPEEKYLEVEISPFFFCSKNQYYKAVLNEREKILNDSITEYVKKFEHIIVLEESQELKELGLDPSKNIVKKKIKFKDIRKFEIPLSQRDVQCSLQDNAPPWNYPHATLVDIK